jgi:hypothetical protein
MVRRPMRMRPSLRPIYRSSFWEPSTRVPNHPRVFQCNAPSLPRFAPQAAESIKGPGRPVLGMISATLLPGGNQ